MALHHDNVLQEFLSKGFVIKSGEIYKNYSTPMLCICPSCGEEHYKSLNSLRNSGGLGCNKCRNKLSGRTQAHTIEYITQHFEDNHCKLLSTEYKNAHQLLEYICICGLQNKINFQNFQQGKRCRNCSVGAHHYKWRQDRDRYKLDQIIAKRARKLVNRVFEAIGHQKEEKTVKLLGYSARDLLEHLKTFPNWENLRKGIWHIDHIFPVKAFLDYGIHLPSMINALDNLQPLSEKENQSKGIKYNKEQFEKYIEIKYQ